MNQAWRRLGRALKAKPTSGQFVAAALCLLLGFALATQVRSTWRSDYSTLRQNELVEVLDQLSQRADQLRQENADMATQLEQLRDSATRDEAARQAAETQSEVDGILAGTIPAKGPGVEITLEAGDARLEPSLLAALVDELRNAGAEAIQVDDVRITAQSWFAAGTKGALVADGVELASPYTWLAIGDSDTLAAALSIPGGAVAAIRAVGAEARVTPKDNVQIDAIRPLPSPSVAAAIE